MSRHNQESIIDCSNLNMTSFPTSLPIVNDTTFINTNKVRIMMMMMIQRTFAILDVKHFIIITIIIIIIIVIIMIIIIIIVRSL